jgi:hypothetical protein
VGFPRLSRICRARMSTIVELMFLLSVCDFSKGLEFIG